MKTTIKVYPPTVLQNIRRIQYLAQRCPVCKERMRHPEGGINDENSPCYDCSHAMHYGEDPSQFKFDTSIIEDCPELYKAYQGQDFDPTMADREFRNLKRQDKKTQLKEEDDTCPHCHGGGCLYCEPSRFGIEVDRR